MAKTVRAQLVSFSLWRHGRQKGRLWFSTGIKTLLFLFLLTTALKASEEKKPNSNCDRVTRLASHSRRTSPQADPSVARLTKILQDLRIDGNPAPLSYEEFDAQIAQIALYLVGSIDTKGLAQNRFFSTNSEKPSVDKFLRGAKEHDHELLRTEIETRIGKHIANMKYQGQTTKAAIQKFAVSKTVGIVTHPLSSWQGMTAKDFSERAPGALVGWLVGVEASDPLLRSVGDEASLVSHSPGGKIPFPLESAETVFLAGGALDQCLAQTILSIATDSKASSVTIKVVTPHTYLEQSQWGGSGKANHQSIKAFLAEPREEREDRESEITDEINEMMKEGAWTPSNPSWKIGDTVTYKKGNREITIQFVD